MTLLSNALRSWTWLVLHRFSDLRKHPDNILSSFICPTRRFIAVYKKILVPVDGSEGSSQALEHCLRILENEKPEKVVLFHAVSYPVKLESCSGKVRSAMKKVKEDLEEYGVEILKNAKSKMTEKNTDVSVETKLIWEDPKYAIVMEADEGQYDLLIMGSRGLSGIKSFFVGSVSSYVAQHVKCTIILVKEW